MKFIQNCLLIVTMETHKYNIDSEKTKPVIGNSCVYYGQLVNGQPRDMIIHTLATSSTTNARNCNNYQKHRAQKYIIHSAKNCRPSRSSENIITTCRLCIYPSSS